MVLFAKGRAEQCLWIWIFFSWSHVGTAMLQSMMPTPAPIPPFTSHSGQVCSSWGYYHYKTFSGDIYHFPGTCNYLFASHCKSNNDDFNIQIRRSDVNGIPTISSITAMLFGVMVELKNQSIMLDGDLVKDIPAEKSSIHIRKLGNNIEITASSDVSLIWNQADSLLLKLNRNKYAKQTCGLCGDFSGVPGFKLDGEELTPVQYGNLQKINGPNEECLDVPPSTPMHCTDEEEICKNILTSEAFYSCNSVLEPMHYIDACVQDLCRCDSKNKMQCKCSMFAEYSRQCTHASGMPENWRTPEMCPESCPNNMVYQECGSPCANTCSNPERTMLCERHCTDGCFCPPGTVLDDINNTGCIPQEQCSCVYNSETYTPGSSFNTPCRQCTCSKGKWKCKEFPCTGSCSVEGGSHITSFDGSRYSINGDCSYVLAKHNTGNDFSVLAEIRRCEITNKKSCLKSIALGLNKGETVLVMKENGALFLNWIPIQLPISVANMTIFWSTSFYINIHIGFGFVIQVQLVPVMQVYITLGPSYHNQTSGLCGNFNNMQSDDFKANNGVPEGTAAGFANRWKTNSNCANIKNTYEDQCFLNMEREKYAQYWCGLLTSANGPFSPCHSIENPFTYYTNCLSDTCSCKDSEECMCAALASYAFACAKKSVTLIGWRDTVCEKYTKTCKDSQVYQYNVTRGQPMCRSRSNDATVFNFEFSPVDGCVCKEGTYLNDQGDCVESSSCPCYSQGNVLESGEMIEENGMKCTCERGELTCMGAVKKPQAVCSHPLVYFNCSSAPKGTKGVECQKSCHTLDMDCFSSQCMSGCVCPPGLVSDEKGGCISEQRCPCIHNEATYKPGDIISVGCNTCTCKNRRWQCTHKPCLGTCSVFGDGHHITFDNKAFTFSGKCEYILAQDNCGENGGQNSFRVITENVPCGTTGTTCTKNIKFFIADEELRLEEEKIEVLKRDEYNKIPYEVIRRGMYIIIKSENGVYLMWDTRTTVHLKLAPHFQRNVCGLCGNYDGNANNDFTTRSGSVVENLMEFGNSWETDPKCPDVNVILDPCAKNPYRKAWALKQCSIITSDVFKSCHSQVDPSKYYESCIRDSCACDTGGDCECFCTTVALYAQACSENGICVHWRTPTICPIFCDYYNDVGECEWHYKPCGDKCMKTCRNPKGECLHELSGCEGCYPKCPPSRPFFNEDTMKCVANCGCVEHGIYYNYGDKVQRSCHSCVCAINGIKCHYDINACQCIYEGKVYNYKDTIPSSKNEDSKCSQMTCEADGNILKIKNCTDLQPTTPPTANIFVIEETFTTANKPSSESTPSSIKNVTSFKTTTDRTTKGEFKNSTKTSTATTLPRNPTTTVSTKTIPVCHWTKWIDENHPTSNRSGGDKETYEIAKNNGIEVCSNKEAVKDIECRATSYRSVNIRDLPQKVTCNPKSGLLCNNQDNLGPNNMCLNYEIKLLCCNEGVSVTTKTTMKSTIPSTSTSHVPNMSTTEVTSLSAPTVLTTTRGHSTTTSAKPSSSSNPTTTVSTTTIPVCYWTKYVNINHPTSDIDGGEKESYEIAKAHGEDVCKYKEDITAVDCRVSAYAHLPFKSILQNASCDVENGLLCKNQDNPGLNNRCPDSKIAFFCCPPSTTTRTSTTDKLTSSSSHFPNPTTTEVTSLPTLAVATTTRGHPTPTSTATTSPRNPTTTVSTKTIPVCHWTKWIDENHPTSNRSGGDKETYEIAKNNGIEVCSNKEAVKDIECRATSYRSVNIRDLPQKVTCNPKSGLLCNNQDNLGPNNMCLNYEIKLLCCNEGVSVTTKTTMKSTIPSTSSSHVPNMSTTEVTSLSAPTVLTTTRGHSTTTSAKPSSSSKPTTTVSTTTIPVCYWTKYVNINHPTSDIDGGEKESYEIAKAHGEDVCKYKEDITAVDCRVSAYAHLPFKSILQNASCDVENGLLCKNQDNPGLNNRCPDSKIAFFCCPPSTTTRTSTTDKLTSSSSHFPNPTTTEVTSLPTLAVATTTRGHPTPTSTATTSPRNPTTTVSTKTIPVCHWTKWIDENHPTSNRSGGDKETYEIAKNNGIEVCSNKEAVKDIECRATSYRSVNIRDLPQKVTCNPKSGLLCNNQDNLGPNNMCLNYEIKLLCCNEGVSVTTKTTMKSTIPSTSSSHVPNMSTTEVTSLSAPTVLTTTRGHSTTTSAKPSSSSNPTTTVSTTTIPVCYWTKYVNINHPTSDIDGGEKESYEIAKAHGEDVCKYKEDITAVDCRVSAYAHLPFKSILQNASCDVENGLLCKNQDNPGLNNRCPDSKIAFFCCPPSTTTRISTTDKLTLSSSHFPNPTTTEVTSLPTLAVTTTTRGHPTPTSTATTSPRNPTTTVSATTIPVCYWTKFVNVNHPTSDIDGGEKESYEIAKAHGEDVCKYKEDITAVDCRVSAYAHLPFKSVLQNASCDVENGLLCKNQDNPGLNNRCPDSKIAFFCCPHSTTTRTSTTDKLSSSSSHSPNPTTTEVTSLPTLAVLTTPRGHSTTASTATTSPRNPTTTVSATTIPVCYWTKYVNINHPTSDKYGGDKETYEIAKDHGEDVCKYKEDITAVDCRVSAYPHIPFKRILQNASCDVENGLLCENKNNPGHNNGCYDYTMAFFCCPTMTTTRTSPRGQHTSLSSYSPNPITTEVTSLPTPAVATTTRGHSTTSSTATTSPRNPTTTVSATTIPVCYWTKYVNINHPTSDKYGGDKETYEIAKDHGEDVCKYKEDITAVDCRVSAYPHIPFKRILQNASCDVENGLLCENKNNPGHNNGCYDYTMAFFCCPTMTTTRTSPRGQHTSLSSYSPNPITTEVTSLPTPAVATTTRGHSTTSSTATTSPRNPTTTVSATTIPVCYWTKYVNINHPTSDKYGGDKETYEIAKDHGEDVCKYKEDITAVDCRVSAYPHIPFKRILQNASCDVENGLLCENKNNPGHNNGCYDYTMAFFCCPSMTTTRTSPRGQHTSLSSHSPNPITTEVTSLPTPAVATTTRGHSTTSSTATSSPRNPTTTVSATTIPVCYWTKYVNINHPTSDKYGGDKETYEIAKDHGEDVCKYKEDIKAVDCRVSAYPHIPFKRILQNASCDVENGLLCENKNNPGHNNGCYDYTMAFFCCPSMTTTRTSPRGQHTSLSSYSPNPITTEVTSLPTPAVATTTRGHSTTSSTATTSPRNPTTTVSATTIPVCYWTKYVNINHPTSDKYGGDKETYEIAKDHGEDVCKYKEDITAVDCRVSAYPHIPFKRILQNASCDVENGLLCENKNNPGHNNGCYDYTMAFFCCPTMTTTRTSPRGQHTSLSSYSPNPITTEVTSLPTPAVATTTRGHSTTSSTATTSPRNPTTVSATTIPVCYWTKYVNINHPTSDKYGGDKETYEIAKDHGEDVCKYKEDITAVDCRVSAYPHIPFKRILQNASCDVENGLLCENKNNPGHNNGCYDYTMAFFCCPTMTTTRTSPRGQHTSLSSYSPNPITTDVTSLPTPAVATTTRGHSTTSSTATSSPRNPTTTVSATTIPVCYWTKYVNINHPTSDKYGGDKETYEIAKDHREDVCKYKEDIKAVDCRVSAYPHIPFKRILQNASCDVENGLLCENKNNPGHNNGCYDYTMAFFCCPSMTTTRTSPRGQHTSLSSYSPNPITTEVTSLPTPAVATTTRGHSTTSLTATTSPRNPTTTVSATTIPVCYWTKYVNINHPTSDKYGGDKETYEIAKDHGEDVCKYKEDITAVDCRVSAYPHIPFKRILQNASCDVENGLLCENKNNPGHNNGCYDYTMAFFCCPSMTTTRTSPRGQHTSLSSHSPNPITTDVTSLPTPAVATTTRGHSTTSSTATTSPRNPTITVSATTIPVCYWTKYVNINHPTSDKYGGDKETYEIAKDHGEDVCKYKEDITAVDCRVSAYPHIPFKRILQNASCDVENGLLCENKNNPGHNNGCYDYTMAFFCCPTMTTTRTSPRGQHTSLSSYSPNPITTEVTSLPTPAVATTTRGHSTTSSTATTSPRNPTTVSATTIPVCYWTKYVNINHPTSDKYGGDKETYEIAKDHGEDVCKYKEDITAVDCRVSAYPHIPFKRILQNASCDVENGLLCENKNNPGHNNGCYDYTMAFFCCPSMTTTRTSPRGQHTSLSSHSPNPITTEVTSLPTPAVATTTRSHFTTSSTATSSPRNPTTTVSATTIPVCYWTKYVNINHPTSDKYGGDKETYEIAKDHGEDLCKYKEDIKAVDCRVSAYPHIPFKRILQNASCDVENGLLCENKNNPGHNNGCYDYTMAFFCCPSMTTTRTSPRGQHTSLSSYSPNPITTEVTSLPTLAVATTTRGHSTTSSTATTSPRNPTTTVSATTIPVCYWTKYVNINHPTSDKYGGDKETYEIAKDHGEDVCKYKEDIKAVDCRVSAYPHIPFKRILQNASCDVENGLLCENKNNPGHNNGCYDYAMAFFCCLSMTTTRTSPRDQHTSSSNHSPNRSTIENTTSATRETSLLATSTSNASSTGRSSFCVYQGSKYKVGSPLPKKSGSCEECKCTMENYSPKVTCKIEVCQTHCRPGHIYEPEPGQCCGKCVQNFCQFDATEMIKGHSDENLPEQCCENCSQDVCAINNTVYFKPGKLWRPPGDNCTCYDCEPKKFTVIKRVMSCPVQKPLKCEQGLLVNFTSADGCCTIQSCEPGKCDVMKSWKVIENEGCEANVTITNCGGYCMSMSRHPSFPKMMEHDCTCCQPTKTTTKKVHLLCKSGRKISYSYTDVLQCGCRGAACVFTE
ncbi:mucin-5AC-like [Dendropsophus ebraccatus]|uniref:mucin-5AC-like n=1 Tax=Dendropsophus ebraccatus TaxID=150705 RepID=UPI003831CA9A